MLRSCWCPRQTQHDCRKNSLAGGSDRWCVVVGETAHADVVTIEASDRGLRGSVAVPGDKSLSHRAAIFAALAGEAQIGGLSRGEDVACTVAAMIRLGAKVDGSSWSGGELRAAAGELDVGNSGTSIRLLMGLLSGVPGTHRLAGDASLARRPMERVAGPLRQMGADVTTTEGCPPVTVVGASLHGIRYESPVASAQVKSAVLLAGLWADGSTSVVEPHMTRRHTEEMFDLTGCDWSLHGTEVSITPGRPQPFSLVVPRDPSQAAFWAVAGSIVTGSDILLTDVYLGPGRDGFLTVLRSMGADIDVVDERPFSVAVGSRVADLRVRAAELQATTISGELVGSSIDEIPVLALAAAVASGTTVVRDATELRVKESDRVVSTVAALQALGVDAEATDDGFVVHGRPGPLRASQPIDAALDHRIAMMGAIGGLVSVGGSHVSGFSSVSTSYPSFLADLAALR